MAKVLIVEDDHDIAKLLEILLERAGHLPSHSADGPSGLRTFFAERPDLVVLDIGLPGMDGWEVLSRIRELSDVPVLILTAQGDELDRVRGLREGADDFVAKPFGRQELLARVDALLRRAAIRPRDEDTRADVYRDGAITVDHAQRTVAAHGDELRLTPTEFRLLAAFVRNPGRVLGPDEIIEMVWGDEWVAREQVKLAVARLRRRLEGHLPVAAIETVRGFGYRYHPVAATD